MKANRTSSLEPYVLTMEASRNQWGISVEDKFSKISADASFSVHFDISISGVFEQNTHTHLQYGHVGLTQ